jgi:hypothetical protein
LCKVRNLQTVTLYDNQPTHVEARCLIPRHS